MPVATSSSSAASKAVEKTVNALGSSRTRSRAARIDGVACTSSTRIVDALSEHEVFVVYAYVGGGPVAINPFDLIVRRIVVKGFFLTGVLRQPQ